MTDYVWCLIHQTQTTANKISNAVMGGAEPPAKPAGVAGHEEELLRLRDPGAALHFGYLSAPKRWPKYQPWRPLS